MSEQLNTLSERFPWVTVRPSGDYPAFNCPQGRILELLGALRDEFGFRFLNDVTAIDHYDASPRFEVVYHVMNPEGCAIVRVVTPCDDDSAPSCASVTGLWPAADWHERETFDMFGIRFVGHPDLRRILMWDEYPYHPLRKEFPLAGLEIELPYEDVVERTGLRLKPAPMMGGPFHAPQHGAMSDREPRADDESWTEDAEKDAIQAQRDRPRELNR